MSRFLDKTSDRLNNALEAIGRFVTGTVSFDEARAYIRRTTEDADKAAQDNALLAPERHDTRKFLEASTRAFLEARTGNADKVLRCGPVTNDIRVAWAAQAATRFREFASLNTSDVISDLIGALCHLAVARGQDPVEQVRRGMAAYAEQQSDPVAAKVLRSAPATVDPSLLADMRSLHKVWGLDNCLRALNVADTQPDPYPGSGMYDL